MFRVALAADRPPRGVLATVFARWQPSRRKIGSPKPGRQDSLGGNKRDARLSLFWAPQFFEPARRPPGRLPIRTASRSPAGRRARHDAGDHHVTARRRSARLGNTINSRPPGRLPICTAAGVGRSSIAAGHVITCLSRLSRLFPRRLPSAFASGEPISAVVDQPSSHGGRHTLVDRRATLGITTTSRPPGFATNLHRSEVTRRPLGSSRCGRSRRHCWPRS